MLDHFERASAIQVEAWKALRKKLFYSAPEFCHIRQRPAGRRVWILLFVEARQLPVKKSLSLCPCLFFKPRVYDTTFNTSEMKNVLVLHQNIFFFCLSCQLRETRMKLYSLYRRVTDVTSWYNNETEQRHRGDTWGKWGSQRRVLLCVASHSLSIIYVGACSDESSFVRVAWSEYFLKISSMFDIDRTGWSQRGREDGLPASSPVTEAMFPRDVKRLSSKLLKVLKNNKNLNLLKLFWVNYLGYVKLKFKLVDVEANRGQR